VSGVAGNAKRIRITSVNNASVTDMSNANFTLTSTGSISQIQWSGYWWDVRSWGGNPGSNNWAANSSNIYVDGQGNLHLKIFKIGDKWYCSEIDARTSFGYGEYTFEVSSNLENFDKNIVLGLFTYESDKKEIDLEFSRWSIASNPVGWYIVKPTSNESSNNFSLNLQGSYSTHKFLWSKDEIFFQSFQGYNTVDLMNQFKYIGTNNPTPGKEVVILNFWLNNGQPPSNNQEAEVIIKSFKYKPIEPAISLTVPTGNEKWEIGEKKLIQWKSSNLTGRVNIEINGDYPKRGWDPVAMNIVDTGSYLYSVEGTEGSTKRIRISSVNNANVKAESGNLTFTKQFETITIKSPKGGEKWPLGSIQSIEWVSNSLSQNVNIEVNGYYPNGSWETLERNIPNDQIYLYTVNGTEGTAKRIRVSLTDKQTIKGESNDISFTPPISKIKVLEPNGNNNWEIGSTYNILWESLNLNGNVSIEVNGNFPDGNWEKIADNIPNSGSFKYKIEGTPGSQKRIRIKSASNPIISDNSDQNFIYTLKQQKASSSIIDILVWFANNMESPEKIENSNLYKLYYEEHKKEYGFFGASFPLKAGGDIGIKMYIDLADYYSAEYANSHPKERGITLEGSSDGKWITVWVNAEVSAGVGISLPFGMGYTGPIEFTDSPDPKMTFEYSAIKTTTPIFQCASLVANEDKTSWSSFDYARQIPELSVKAEESSFNLLKFEIDKSLLDAYMSDCFGRYLPVNGVMDLISGKNRTDALIDLITSFTSLGTLTNIILNPNLLTRIRPFSSTDNNEIGVDGVLSFLYGGIDINGDRRKDNYYPVIPKTHFKLPLENNNADLVFQNIGPETADFYIRVKDCPKGWIVKAADDKIFEENNIIDKIYEAPDVPHSEIMPNFYTLWTIGCLYDAPDEADITFELYHDKNWISSKLLDTKTVKVKKLVTKQESLKNNTPVFNPIYPNVNVNLGRDDEIKITWTDSDLDDNATIAIALDPDVFLEDNSSFGPVLNPKPWEGKDNHIWIAKNLKEDDDGSAGSFTFKTKGIENKTWCLWAVIYDGKTEPQYVKFDGLITILPTFDDMIPYNLINSIQDKWFNANPLLDIDSFDDKDLNTTSYQIVSGTNLKNGLLNGPEFSSSNLEEDKWKPLTTNGATILEESQNNLSDSLKSDWKMYNSDWDSITSNNQDLEKHYLVLKITDDNGNTYITPDRKSAFELKIDVHSPNVSILNPVEKQNLLTNTVDVNWKADDLFNGIQLSGIDAMFVALDQSMDFVQLGSNATNYSFTDVNNGVHTIYVKAKDKAGNFSDVKHVNFSINSDIPLSGIITSNVASISSIDALGGGMILDSKGVEITARGLCWSLLANPTINISTKTNDGIGSGIFSANITGLAPETIYHVRAYATSSAGTAYGDDIVFKTLNAGAINSVPANAGQISGTTVVCQGQNSLTYSVPVITGASSYIWTLPSGSSGTSVINSIIVNFSKSAITGNISVKGHNENGDGVSSNLAIIVNPVPDIPIITQNGVLLHSNALNGNQWYNQNVEIAGANSQDYTITTIGDYTVKVTLNGCSSTSSNTIKDVTTAVDSYENKDQINIYPNPVADDLSIQHNGNNDQVKYDIFNSSGQLITSGMFRESTIVHTNSFANGIYMIKFNTGKIFEFRKIIKKN
jgi:hypothetical protein